MALFLSKDILDKVSYRSSLDRSLKNISLHKITIEEILEDIGGYRKEYFSLMADQPELFGPAVAVPYRFKSDDSLILKYEKGLRENKSYKQCFNDVLSFRLRLEKYLEVFPEYFRVVDMRKGKKQDDGYRAIHLYYQRDNFSYPIEVQLWCGGDYLFDLWSHRHLYKYKSPALGCRLYREFAAGGIPDEERFLERLRYWEERTNG